ncbi:MAG: GMP synthase [Ignavibacteria bacterium]|nr:MAG: GMP synthase [Ignavibacteria bacterium]
MRKQKIKIATIDLYNNERNEGMRCIGEIAEETKKKFNDLDISYNVYETRFKENIPGMDYDIFISSGGPGSPFEGEGKKWEKDYFNLIGKIYSHNQTNTDKKKYIFFICHSFQMMARFFEFGDVSKRNSKSIGVMPFEKTESGKADNILNRLTNPFYAADIREYQVKNPNRKVIDDIGAKILSYEILDDNAEGEPAIAAVKISNEIFGTQFHPEADPESMLYHFNRPDEKKQIVDTYGKEKYIQMLEIIQEPNAVKLTRKTVIPNFLNGAIDELNKVLI